MRPEDIPAAAAIMAAAFNTDPCWRWLFPDDARRETHLRWIFERWTRCAAPVWEAHVTPDLEGAALWIPPGREHAVTLRAQLAAGLGAAPFRLGLGWFRRSLIFQKDMNARMRADLVDPHWALDIIAVDPARQSRGVGARLLRHQLAKADQSGIPVYVITHNPANIAYYARFGFRLLHRYELLPGGPETCSMRRPVGKTLLG